MDGNFGGVEGGEFGEFVRENLGMKGDGGGSFFGGIGVMGLGEWDLLFGVIDIFCWK